MAGVRRIRVSGVLIKDKYGGIETHAFSRMNKMHFDRKVFVVNTMLAGSVKVKLLQIEVLSRNDGIALNIHLDIDILVEKLWGLASRNVDLNVSRSNRVKVTRVEVDRTLVLARGTGGIVVLDAMPVHRSSRSFVIVVRKADLSGEDPFGICRCGCCRGATNGQAKEENLAQHLLAQHLHVLLC